MSSFAPSTHSHPDPPPASLSTKQVILVTIGAALLVFAGFEILEQAAFQHGPAERIQLFGRLRVFFSLLAVAAALSWSLMRRSPPLLAELAHDAQVAGALPPHERTAHYASWFIRMRWVAVVTALLLVLFAIHVVRILPDDALPLLVVTVGLLASLNFTYWSMLRARVGLNYLLAVQAYGDLIVLTLLLHYSGGVENPMATVFLFHVIIAGIVMSRRQCYLVAAAASALFAFLVFAEGSGLVQHYTLLAFPHVHTPGGVYHAARAASFAVSAVTVQTTILFLTAYFTTTITERLRRDEVRLAAFTERLLAQTQQLGQEIMAQKQLQARIVQAEKLAAVGELAGKVAHEVNNPIAIISAKTRLLLSDEDALSHRTRDELQKIAQLTDRVARTAQGLLSYCRPVAGPKALLDVCESVRKAVAFIEAPAAAAGVQVEQQLPPERMEIVANAGEIEQVLLNVMLNALDAMQPGGHLSVAVARVEEALDGDDAALEIVVQDDGCGIPEEVRDHVFEPFVTTKGAGRGTGLGLSISRALVRSNGGDITLESEPGSGTRARIRLSRATSWAEAAHV